MGYQRRCWVRASVPCRTRTYVSHERDLTLDSFHLLSRRPGGTRNTPQCRRPPEKIIVTGDDAVGLAGRFGSTDPGKLLGFEYSVCRIFRRTSVDLRRISDVIRRVVPEIGAEAIVIPISQYEDEEDSALQETFSNEPWLVPTSPIVSPEDVINCIARTRLVLTGSYHAAVFALAMGRPAICIAASDYYRSKFYGLADQFGSGCMVIDLESECFGDRLAKAVVELWVLPPPAWSCCWRQLGIRKIGCRLYATSPDAWTNGR